MSLNPPPPWQKLAARLEGELHDDELHRILFATDASVYRELPRAVAFPRTEADLVACVDFAREYGIPITPRAGGTSLAGQAVGNGLIVDVSRHMRNIIEINVEKGYAIVEPGVIRDQLNDALREHGCWFGPNTSTANRCTMGGMFGNNSCGSTSITVGSTREHVLGARVVLSSGEVYKADDAPAGSSDEYVPPPIIHRFRTWLDEQLSNPVIQQLTKEAYPKPGVTRRNNGYALDILARQFELGQPLNLCTLLAGSEGTLALTSQLKVCILPLPPRAAAVVALHFDSIDAALRATETAMETQPFMCELMDDTILKLALQNHDQRKNASFVEGMPRALLLVEYRGETEERAYELAEALSSAFAPRPPKGEDAEDNAPYATPIITGQTEKVWALRSAGLGILGNMVGDAKAVACIEDTAVALPDLPDYIADFSRLMKKYDQHPVYYAHAGAGELHLRPILNLKEKADRRKFHDITRDVAQLVKKYGGSLSGEHGDGRVRGQFLRDMLGEEVYGLLVELKQIWDPQGIFNPGKIVEAPPMYEDLRYAAGQTTPDFTTVLDFSEEHGILRAAEKCNGSGDCRKLTGGAMCPSYRATLHEKDSTRGRANVLREVLTRNQREDPWTHPALSEAMDLCLACKACTSECPSTVNMTALKAEYLHQKQEREGVDLRTRLVAANETLYRLGGMVPGLANTLLDLTGPLMKRVAGIAPERSLPRFPKESLRKFYERERPRETGRRGKLYFFGDEFINYQDVEIGRAALRLWWALGYEVVWPRHASSARAQLSKGLLREARRHAADNVLLFKDLISEDTPLVGLEPSAILGFRDEYPRLLRGDLAAAARRCGEYALTFDEWAFREFTAGRIGPDDFTDEHKDIVLHVHCHEKALGEAQKCAAVLSLPKNFNVTLLDSGCCGMAGSFGYEAEHYEVSQWIAEQSLFSKIRGLSDDTVLVAAGTSCRHQVWDGMGVRGRHVAEVLSSSVDGRVGPQAASLG